MKKNIIKMIALMFISGVFGYVYEVIFYYFNGGMDKIYLRGICFGPYIDIYIIGGLLIYLVCSKFKNKPYLVFLISGILSGILEYSAGKLIYILFDGKRSWDYNTEILNFGNIQGFVCLRSILFFAISGIILMYLIVPLIEKLIDSKHKKIINKIIAILFIIMLFDEVYNMLIKLNIINLPSAGEIYSKLGFNYWKS